MITHICGVCSCRTAILPRLVDVGRTDAAVGHQAVPVRLKIALSAYAHPGLAFGNSGGPRVRVAISQYAGVSAIYTRGRNRFSAAARARVIANYYCGATPNWT